MRKVVGNLLFYYGALFGLFLTGTSVIALMGGVTSNGVISLMFFLPVPLYFIWQMIVRIYLWRYRKKLGLVKVKSENDYQFTLRAFFNQDNAEFQITLGLLSLAVSGTLLRALLMWQPTVLTENDWFEFNIDSTNNNKVSQNISNKNYLDLNDVNNKLVYQLPE